MTLRQSLRRLAGVLVPRPAVNAVLRWVRGVLGPVRFDALMGRGHRHAGYRLLSGRGIEIGALHAPAVLPRDCQVTYVDAISTAQARRLFPEVDAARLVPVEIVTDLDTEGLSAVADGSMDFAVMNHVIEHVANPIKVIEELFRVVRPGGHVVISAPDMRFSFDRGRTLTSNQHLLDEYRAKVCSVTDAHYADYVNAVLPGISAGAALSAAIEEARTRREHAHVWNSETFSQFMAFATNVVGIVAERVACSEGDQNRLEHFSVWQRHLGLP